MSKKSFALVLFLALFSMCAFASDASNFELAKQLYEMGQDLEKAKAREWRSSAGEGSWVPVYLGVGAFLLFFAYMSIPDRHIKKFWLGGSVIFIIAVISISKGSLSWPFYLMVGVFFVLCIYRSPDRRTKKMWLGGFVIFIITAASTMFFDTKKKWDLEANKLDEKQQRDAASAAYRTVFKKDGDLIKVIFDGENSLLSAGAKEVYSPCEDSTSQNYPSMDGGSWNVITCTRAIPGLFPKDHPITVNLRALTIYTCSRTVAGDKKNGTKAISTEQNYRNVITGFGLSYYNKEDDSSQYYSLVSSLLDAGFIGKHGTTVGKGNKLIYISSPNNEIDGNMYGYDSGNGKGVSIFSSNGLSVIWSKAGDEGVDLCGNPSFPPK